MATKKNVNVTNAGSEKVDTEIRRRKEGKEAKDEVSPSNGKSTYCV